MPDFTLSAHHTLHDITEGNPNFTGIVHVQSQDGKEFMFGYPSQKNLDEGLINFSSSKGGYASVNINANSGIGMIALKSAQPITVRVWSDSISTSVSSTSPRPSHTENPPNQVQLSPTSLTNSSTSVSIVVWIGVILALVFIMIKRKK